MVKLAKNLFAPSLVCLAVFSRSNSPLSITLVLRIMDVVSTLRQLIVRIFWGTPKSIKILFGTAGLQRWSVETVKEVFRMVQEHGVNDLDTAHIYVSSSLH